MNLLLLDPSEVSASGAAVLSDERALHIATVLRSAPGDALRAGLLDGPTGRAEILSVERRRVTLRFYPEQGPVALSTKTLILGIPRPKVLSRCLEHASTLGYGRIFLVRSKRVEKSHLLSSAMNAESIRRHLRLGLEQGRRTRLPQVHVFERFRPFVAELATSTALPTWRVIAHQDSVRRLTDGPLTSESDYALAIGPEGGWLDFEVEGFEQAGFVSFQFGVTPLRVESALSYASGQLDLRAAGGCAPIASQG